MRAAVPSASSNSNSLLLFSILQLTRFFLLQLVIQPSLISTSSPTSSSSSSSSSSPSLTNTTTTNNNHPNNFQVFPLIKSKSNSKIKINGNSNINARKGPSKLSFHHNVTLTVSLQVGSPPQNVTMVLDTGSELSYLNCNQTRNRQILNFTRTTPSPAPAQAFDPTRSSSYSNVSCSSPTCTLRTRDFPIPVSCDQTSGACHATLSYADMSSSEGALGSDTFGVGSTQMPGIVFGCMVSGFSSDPEEDAKTTGLLGMNRGSLSFASQMGFQKFSYCISGSDFLGLLLLGDANFTWLAPLNYTPLIQISDPLPYFNRVAYTVYFEGIRVGSKLLQLPRSVLEPDHTGAGQTMVDSGTQFTFLLGPAYQALRSEFLNRTSGVLRVLDDPDFVFQQGMDLCYRVPAANEAAVVGGLAGSLPPVTLVFRGAEMEVSGRRLLYKVPGEVRDGDGIYCFTFGNSDLLGVEAYVIGHLHQQDVWMEFDLEKSRIGLAQVRCDLAVNNFDLQRL